MLGKVELLWRERRRPAQRADVVPSTGREDENEVVVGGWSQSETIVIVQKIVGVSIVVIAAGDPKSHANAIDFDVRIIALDVSAFRVGEDRANTLMRVTSAIGERGGMFRFDVHAQVRELIGEVLSGAGAAQERE